jgi:uncharacterized protein (DUF849 family)
VLGIRNGFQATPETLLHARSLLPADAVWAAMGIGRMEFPIVAQACLLGSHVLVGLEDNLYLSKGETAPSNAALVERAFAIVELLGRGVGTPARRVLGLRPWVRLILVFGRRSRIPFRMAATKSPCLERS